MGEGVRQGDEEDGAAAGEGTLEQVVQDEGAARIHAVFHEDHPAAGTVSGGGGQRMVEQSGRRRRGHWEGDSIAG